MNMYMGRNICHTIRVGHVLGTAELSVFPLITYLSPHYKHQRLDINLTTLSLELCRNLLVGWLVHRLSTSHQLQRKSY
jgi:hypothetical protein